MTGQRVLWTRVLCILGLGVSSYLAWVYLSGGEPYCAGAHGCSQVQHSRYATLLGVPVPLIGIAGYTLLLGLSLGRGRASGEMAFYLPVLSFGVALVGLLYSLYLTYLEAFVIHAWCYWCVASAVIMTAIWVLGVWDLRRAWVAE